MTLNLVQHLTLMLEMCKSNSRTYMCWSSSCCGLVAMVCEAQQGSTLSPTAAPDVDTTRVSGSLACD